MICIYDHKLYERAYVVYKPKCYVRIYDICIYMCDICMLSLIWMLIHVSYVCLDSFSKCWVCFSGFSARVFKARFQVF